MFKQRTRKDGVERSGMSPRLCSELEKRDERPSPPTPAKFKAKNYIIIALIKAIIRNITDHTTVDKTTKDASLIFFLKAKAIGYAKAIDPVINALIRKIVKNIKP